MVEKDNANRALTSRLAGDEQRAQRAEATAAAAVAQAAGNVAAERRRGEEPDAGTQPEVVRGACVQTVLTAEVVSGTLPPLLYIFCPF